MYVWPESHIFVQKYTEILHNIHPIEGLDANSVVLAHKVVEGFTAEGYVFTLGEIQFHHVVLTPLMHSEKVPLKNFTIVAG